MKKFALGAAAAAALLAPAVAHADTNAVVGLDYNHVNFGGGPDANVYGISGAFNHDFSNGWQLQMDGATDRLDGGGCCLNQNYVGAHYGVRNDQYSFAGFVGLQSLFFFSGMDVGIEGQMHFGQASVGGSLSYIDFGDANVNATNVNMDGEYYFTPNFSVNAGAAYTNLDVSGPGNTDFWTWNLGGEYRFDNSPVSVSLGYRQSEFDGGNVNAWTIGLTLDLGTGSLQDRRVKGPSWGGARDIYDNTATLGPFL
ncbi:MAG: porin [Proteobacteria bacterium]|nr:porin [Pseudomonadota bacterium]